MSTKKTVSNKKVAKKTTTKKVAKAKKTISGQQFGRNIVLVIDGKKFSKAFKEKVDRDNILSLVDAYNNSNSIKKEKEIIDLMVSGKSTEKERKQVAKKNSTKKIKKAPEVVNKVPTKEELANYKKILEENDYRVSKVADVAPERARNREH